MFLTTYFKMKYIFKSQHWKLSNVLCIIIIKKLNIKLNILKIPITFLFIFFIYYVKPFIDSNLKFNISNFN